MKRGRKPGSGKSWREHFAKRLDFQGDHWIWLGRQKKNGTGRFSAHVPERRKGKQVSNTAVRFAYWYKYGVEKPKGKNTRSRRMCDLSGCINPDHWRDYSPAKLSPNQDRDRDIIELYNNHLKFKQFNLAGIGRKYGMSRERVRQIVSKEESK